VLVPTQMAPVAADSWHAGTTAPAAPEATAPAEDRLPGHTSRGGMLVDVNRIIRTLEEEAEAAHQRIDHELGRARSEAEAIVRSAGVDADHIRDHAQQQARVLLGEVEEIITDAQRTGQQILRKADAEAEDVRRQAGDLVMEAQGEARKIIDTARREGEQILSEQRRLATVRAQEALREQDRLKEQIHRLEERRRQVLESLEPLIDQLSQMIPATRNVVDFPQGGQAARS
jgi:F0F1-type ATP synthase membrane subunit b/b'